MSWSGKWTTSHTPRYVRVGDYAFPTKVVTELEGDNGNPDITIYFEVRDGRPQVVGVHLVADAQGRQIRTSDLQSLPLDIMVKSVFTGVAMKGTYDPETNVTTHEPVADEREFWAAVNAVDTAVKAPHRGTTKAELEQVAKLYREHLDDRPVQAILTLMGYGHERTAARRVEQARAAGLLPPTTPGKKKA